MKTQFQKSPSPQPLSPPRGGEGLDRSDIESSSSLKLGGSPSPPLGGERGWGEGGCLENYDSPESAKRIPLGEKLAQSGAITLDQLQIALHEQRRNGGMLGAILVRLGFLDEETLANALADTSGLKSVNLSHVVIDTTLLRKFPKASALRCRAVPLGLDGQTLKIAMADPYDVMAMDELRRHFPRPITLAPLVAAKADIEATIDHYYGFATSLDPILRELETGKIAPTDGGNPYQHPVVRLVDAVLLDAVKRGASDIHLEPESTFVRVRYRVDGELEQIRALHNSHWSALSHRLKIMAGMNIADTRSAQNGRFHLQIGGNDVDFRVGTMPTVWGENIVVRLLDHARSLAPLDELGFGLHALSTLSGVMERPQGITLVTGPTGSGKTTTIYAILRKLSDTTLKISTLEDPVEYQLDLIRQTAVNEAQGMGFAEGIRAILRMDPDVIFVGEVRDPDTAHMAMRAAMTGHQIYTTLHCADALGAIPRLVDLGLSPRTIAGNINGIVAQRLVRKLCPHCKIWRIANADECRILRRATDNQLKIAESSGCEYCFGTGAHGRTVVAEVLRFSPELDDMITAGASRSELFKHARSEGFHTLQDDGISRVLSGEIALNDLRRTVDMTRGW